MEKKNDIEKRLKTYEIIEKILVASTFIFIVLIMISGFLDNVILSVVLMISAGIYVLIIFGIILKWISTKKDNLKNQQHTKETKNE